MSEDLAIPEKVISEFTQEDFRQSDKPYAFLYKFIDNPFRLSQMREQLKMHAESVGFKGFIGFWNSYVRSISQTKTKFLDNVTDFNGQPMALNCGDYQCDDYGVTIAAGIMGEIQVCSHPIMPVQRLVNVDTDEEKLKIAFRKGYRWRERIVDKDVLSNQAKIIELSKYGVMVNSTNARYLGQYLMELEQINYNTIPEQRSVGRLGWISNDEFSPYVGELVFDGDESFRHTFSAVTKNGSFDEWLKVMLDLRKGNIFGRLFLASSFASVILQPCGLLPFFVHAWGGTECGKTVGLMIAASVWGNPKLGEYITTFNSTAVAQEFQAGFLNSLPYCLDELQIQSAAGIKDFDRLIYQLAEGLGKARGTKQGGLMKNKTWRNCIITNGEHPISNANSGGGALNRVIEFECTEKVYHDLVGMCQVIQSNYGFAGHIFVDWLQDGHIDDIHKLQKEYYKRLLATNSTDKQAASASAILAADKAVTDLIFKDGRNLTVEDIATIMTDKDTVDVNLRAADYIEELIARHQSKFNLNTFGEMSGEIWGIVEDGYTYFIKSVFDREMRAAGYNSQAFLSWAKRTGRIVTGGEKGRTTKLKRVYGSSNPVRCVCFPPEVDTSDFEEIDDYDPVF